MIQGDRLKQLEEKIPDIWNYETLLYIGARVVEKTRERWDGMRMIPQFIKAHYGIDILEAWKRNVEELNKFNEEKNVFNKIIHGDVRNIRTLVKQKYDIIMWYHGPEHVEEESVKPTLKYLEFLANYIAIAACPWGHYKQASIAGNYYEIHISHLYPEFFEYIGWQTDTLGEMDVKGSNLLTWRRKKALGA